MTIKFNKIILKIALGASLFATYLQASDHNNILEEPISKKRPAEGEPGPGEHTDKKPRTQKSEDDTPSDIETEEFFSEDIFFELVPQDILFHICFFLKSKDLNKLALVSKLSYEHARDALMLADIRELKDKEWIGGPTKGTFENYLFNHVIWEMGLNLIKGKTKNGKISLRRMGPLLRGFSYLEKRFENLKALGGVIEGFSSPQEYSETENGMLMAENAVGRPRSGEADFLSLLHYLGNDKYLLPENTSHPMNLVERFHHVKKARHQIDTGSDPLDANNETIEEDEESQEEINDFIQKASLWDTILTYDLEPPTIDDLTSAAQCHQNVGLFCDAEQRLASLSRAAHLHEIIIEKKETDATIGDITNAILAYQHLSGAYPADSEKSLSWFERLSQLHEAILEKRGPHADKKDLIETATIYFNIGMHSRETSQKLTSFIRSAKLREDLLIKKGDKVKAQDIENTITAYTHVAENALDLETKKQFFERIKVLRSHKEKLENTTRPN